MHFSKKIFLLANYYKVCSNQYFTASDEKLSIYCLESGSFGAKYHALVNLWARRRSTSKYIQN